MRRATKNDIIYVNLNKKSLPCLRVKRVLSTLPIIYPCSNKKVLSLAYHARGASLSPYKAFKSLYTLLEYFGVLKTWGLRNKHFLLNDTI
jgi:hypothetical protein